MAISSTCFLWLSGQEDKEVHSNFKWKSILKNAFPHIHEVPSFDIKVSVWL